MDESEVDQNTGSPAS